MIEKQRSHKTQVDDILRPVRGIRDEMAKKGVKPKDHAKENFQKMKQKEREIKAKRDEEANSKPAQPWKMKKFNEVESKVTRTLREAGELSTMRSQADHFQEKVTLKSLKQSEKQNQQQMPTSKPAKPKYSPHKDPIVEENIYNIGGEEEPIMKPGTPPNQSPELGAQSFVEGMDEERKRKPSVPKASDLSSLAPHKNEDYVYKNAASMVGQKGKMQEKKKLKTEIGPHEHQGKVPDYLKKYRREQEKRKEQKAAAAEAASCPAGTRRMTEEERQETLKGLYESKQELQNLLEKMPIALKTKALEKRKHELEQKFLEAEKAIETFSRKDVFIAI